MLTSKISSKGQTVLPREIRERLGLEKGSTIWYQPDGDHVILRKIDERQIGQLQVAFALFSEWLSPEDEEAFRDLQPR
jgi:AbrB family looped-hinge helix DNA binding protein